ncbi:uncharacterized protein LOC112050927 isoform X3 [Bicyclus anynana]|uniref:Uncharacterized protein LOC112050927 isoform X3 n=1 Tax=Bicyclus anynana TaxID=110368 RepID=A0ABM3LW41_BICAN|nr:uncharacterized protein LOC112050927 isoform X3 [Bicyclus anynana]
MAENDLEWSHAPVNVVCRVKGTFYRKKYIRKTNEGEGFIIILDYLLLDRTFCSNIQYIVRLVNNFAFQYLKDKEVAVQKREINVTVIKKEQTSGALDDAAELNPLKERIVDLSVDDKITRNLDRDNDQHNSEYLEDSKDRQAEPAVNYNCKHKKGEVQNGTINEIFIKKEQTGDALEDTDDLDPLTERIVDISTDDDVTKNSEQDNDHLDSEYLEDSEEDRPAEPVKRRYRSPKRHERPGRKTRRNLLPKKRPLNRRSAMANLTERFIAIEERRSETESLLARSSAENMQAQTKVLAQLALAVNNLAEAIKTQPFRCNNCN